MSTVMSTVVSTVISAPCGIWSKSIVDTGPAEADETIFPILSVLLLLNSRTINSRLKLERKTRGKEVGTNGI
jgi:hypothetical protein